MALTCVEKVRDKNNKIVAYRIKGDGAYISTFLPEEIKSMLKNTSVTITNLKLTSDGRIISSAETVDLNKENTLINFNTFCSKLEYLIVNKVKQIADGINTEFDIFNSKNNNRCVRNIYVRVNNEYMNNNLITFKIIDGIDKALVNIYSYDCIKYGSQIYTGDCTNDSYSVKMNIKGVTEGSSFLDSCISRAFYSYRTAK